METLTYRFPQGAYLMLGIPVIVLLSWFLHLYRQQALHVFLGRPPTPLLARRRSVKRVTIKTALLALVWMLATLALMDPVNTPHQVLSEASGQATIPHPQALRRKAHDVLLLVDVSASMATTDTRSNESRLTLAKQVADELTARLQGESVALYAFTSELLPIVPVTWDYLFTRLMLRDLQINEGQTAGTDLLNALVKLRALHWDQKSQRAITLVLLTDGGDTTYEALQGNEKNQRLHDMHQVLADRDNLQLIVVGIGSTQGQDVPGITEQGRPVRSSLDVELLKGLTQGQGELLIADNFSAFELAKQLDLLLKKHSGFEEISQPGKATSADSHLQDLQSAPSLYQIPLGLALFFLIVCMLMQEREPLVRKP